MEYKESLSFIKKSIALNPDNYGSTSLHLQLNYALGKHTDTEKIKSKLKKIRDTSSVDSIRNLQEFQFDKFNYKNYQIIAMESFDRPDSLYYHWTMYVVDENNGLIKTINLESSRGIRELGIPYMVGIDKYTASERIHVTTKVSFKKLPDYSEMKRIVIMELDEGLPAGATGYYPLK
jgi:transposase